MMTSDFAFLSYTNVWRLYESREKLKSLPELAPVGITALSYDLLPVLNSDITKNDINAAVMEAG
jgi:hypothetical protein